MGNWNWHKNWKLLAAGLSFLAVFGTPLCGLAEASVQKKIVREQDGLSIRTVKPLQTVRLSERISLPSSSDAETDGDFGIENESFQEKKRELQGEGGALQAESASNALVRAPLFTGPAQDFWSGWNGDLSFLDGSRGDGTEEKPYQISTREHLMGLSVLVAGGMEIREGEGTYPGDYSGAWFELTRNLDLGGIQWIPIGFYENETAMQAKSGQAFDGHFDGNGKTISNFRIYQPDWTETGLFGILENAVVENLTVQPGNILTVKDTAGILAGSAENSVIRDVTVTGTLKTSGTAGGLVGKLSESSVVENCTADHVAIDAGTGKEIFIGGIAGTAAESLVADCTVNTGDSLSARIQGGGYVGGITGFQNGTDIYNVHVMGTIGGTGSQSIGGITGKYASGKMKVARFEGEIASSGLGGASREGTFIGTRDPGFHFRYGTGEGADLAYLFADKEEKIAAGICGSGIADDNRYSYDAHIGFWNSRDNFFSLIQGQNRQTVETRYFYEELENGMLHVIDTEDAVRNFTFAPDHFAPNALGRPVRGYLVSVLQIDTAANVQNYYDVATLTARSESVYGRELDKDNRGAVAPGDVVTVTTAPKNTDEEKYQMDGVPTYTDEDGKRQEMAYQTGGTYSFIMPEHDTELSAVYKKVAASVRIEPEEYLFRVVQERTGDRKNPSVTTEVRDGAGRLLARYLNGELDPGTKVQDVSFEAIVDRENDVADEAVAWSVDDGDLILLKKNLDEDSSGYTRQSASVELNLNADFFNRIISQKEKEQADMQYQYPIPDTVYGNGTLGGLAVLTARTRPSASFEGKPAAANCRISVTFQIKDRTNVAAEGASLNKTGMSFTVTRILSGDRKNPEERMTVTAPETLQAAFSPDYFDKKDVQWSVDDETVIRVNAGTYEGAGSGTDYKNAVIEARRDTKWIQDIMESDDAAYRQDIYRKRDGSGTRKAVVTVTADDTLGNRQTASCEVTVQFRTEDQTEILPETVILNQNELEFTLIEEKAGGPLSETTGMYGFEPKQLSAKLLPDLAKETVYEPYDREIIWESSDSAVTVTDGKVTPVQDGTWIQEARRSAPYHGEKEVTITARAAGNPETLASCLVKLTYDMECLETNRKELVFDMTLTKTGPQRNPVLTWEGTDGQEIQAKQYPTSQSGQQEDENKLVWKADDKLLIFDDEGKIFPVTDADWLTEAMKTYPYTAEKQTEITVSSGKQTETINAVLKFKMTDRTYSSSSGGGSGSGGSSGSGGGSSSGITVNGTTKSAVQAPAGSVTGIWVQDGAGRWLFTSEGRTYASEWAYIHNPYAKEGQENTSWFRFDENGHMQTGWFQDQEDGSWYYLHEQSDGSQGHMYTGWRFLDGNWYYFGADGRMKTGWHWIDGKCYCLDDPSGRMLADRMTPDGYTVDSSGAWTVNGVVQIQQDSV